MPQAPAGPRTLTVVRQQESLGAAADLDFALGLLQKVKTGSLGPTLRLYRPVPTVAFGQRDTHLPGFEAAAAACGSSASSPWSGRPGAGRRRRSRVGAHPAARTPPWAPAGRAEAWVPPGLP